MKKIFSNFLLLFLANFVFAQHDPPGLNLIRIEDLKKDLYAFAAAHFKGRSAGTLDELKAAMWLGEKYRSIGLQPAGDDGTYFQFFNLWRNDVSDRSTVQINNNRYTLWKDVAIAHCYGNSSVPHPRKL